MSGATSCIRSSSRLRGFVRAPAVAATRAGATCRSLAGNVEPLNVAELCQKARLAVTPKEMEDFGPKSDALSSGASMPAAFSFSVRALDVDDVSPAIRVGEIDGTETQRADVPRGFESRDAMLAAAPDLEGPYLKVPKILKENIE